MNGNLAVYLAINGTAIPGADYVPLDSVVVIPDGRSSVSLDVIPFDDLHVEPTEDVILTVLTSTNYNLGSPGQARVQILDNDDYAVPAVGFTFASSARLEREAAEISVSLSATSTAPVTVSYRVIGGTASTNDYRSGPGSLTFEPGELAKPMPIEIVNDTVAEPDETIRIALYDPVGATHDGIRIHTFTILDDDTSSVSVSATANASESGSVPGNFRLTRTGGTSSNLPRELPDHRHGQCARGLRPARHVGDVPRRGCVRGPAGNSRERRHRGTRRNRGPHPDQRSRGEARLARHRFAHDLR